MSDDERKSTYSFQGGTPEVIRLERARAAGAAAGQRQATFPHGLPLDPSTAPDTRESVAPPTQGVRSDIRPRAMPAPGSAPAAPPSRVPRTTMLGLPPLAPSRPAPPVDSPVAPSVPPSAAASAAPSAASGMPPGTPAIRPSLPPLAAFPPPATFPPATPLSPLASRPPVTALPPGAAPAPVSTNQHGAGRTRERQITPHSSAMPALASQAVDELTTPAPIALDTIMPRIERLFAHTEPLLVERFPGPYWRDPRREHANPPRGSEISGIAACLVALGVRAVPSVLRLLASSRSDQRCAAAFVAGQLPFAPVVEALGALALHPDPSSRLAALTVLPDLGQARGAAKVIAQIRSSAAWGKTRDIRMAAIQALEELRDAGAVAMLIGISTESDTDLADRARQALRRITARSFGTLRWKLWLRANGERSRFHWLTDALGQWNGALRSLASEELVRLTGHGRVLPPDARRAEAKGLEAHYLQFWDDEMRQLGVARP